MGAIDIVEHTRPVCKLVKVQIAAEIHLQEGRRRIGEGDVPRLGANAGEGFRRQFHLSDDLVPMRDRGAGDIVPCVGVNRVFRKRKPRPLHHVFDLPGLKVHGAEAITIPPIVVGEIVSRGDLDGGSVDERPVRGDEDQQAHRPKPGSEALGQDTARAEPPLDQIGLTADERRSERTGRLPRINQQSTTSSDRGS